MQLVVNLANAWCLNHGFKFSTAKTVSMHFTRRRGVFTAPHFHPGENAPHHHFPAPFPHLTCDRDKVLGYGDGFKAVLDCSHRGPPHTMPLESATSLLPLSHNMGYGLHNPSLGLQITHPFMSGSWQSDLYGSATTTCLKTLYSIQHRALRLATGAFWSSPVLSL